MVALLVWLAACSHRRLIPLAVVASLFLAPGTEPLTLARYLAAQTIGGLAVWLAGDPRRLGTARLLILAMLADRAEARLWLGQDALFALPALGLTGIVGLICVARTAPRALFGFLALLWAMQGWVDARGLLAWMRPLPAPVQDAWAVPHLPWALALGALTLRLRGLLLAWALALPLTSQLGVLQSVWVPGQLPILATRQERLPGWLLVSNNPEMVHGPGLLLETETPPGKGRVLVSHINRSGTPRDLVLWCDPPVHVTRFSSARDNLWLDAGTLLWQSFERLDQTGSSWVLPGVTQNGLLMLETRTDRPVRWRVYFGQDHPVLPRSGTQAGGVFLDPDQTLRARVQGAGQIPLEGPWLRDAGGQTLAGDYGAVATLHLDVRVPVEVLWKARGGVLDLAPAGCARRLAHLEPGQRQLTVSLPANSFAPSSLLFVPGSFSPLD